MGTNKLKAAMAGLLAAGLVIPLATAEPFTELQARWTEANTSLPNGSTTAVEVRVNSNDTDGVEGEQDIKVSLATQNSKWAAVPDVCTGEGSGLSDNGEVLNCFIPAVEFGTAAQFRASLTADGPDGAMIEPVITVNDSDTVTLDPVPITAQPGINLRSDYTSGNFPSRGEIDNSIPFTISVPRGGEKVDGPMSFTWNINDVDTGSVPASQVLDIAPPTDTNTGVTATCGYYKSTGWKGLPAPSSVMLEDEQFDCTVTPTGTAGEYTVTIDNYNNSLVGRHVLADTGEIILVNGSINFKNTAPIFNNTYDSFAANIVTSDLKATSAAGETLTDINPDDQSTNLAVIKPGNWSAAWIREAWSSTNVLYGQGSIWDTTGKVSFGSKYLAHIGDTRFIKADPNSYDSAGNCIIWDSGTQLVDDPESLPRNNSKPGKEAAFQDTGAAWLTREKEFSSDGLEYFYTDTPLTGYLGEQGVDVCSNDANWSTTKPTAETASKVAGVRHVWSGKTFDSLYMLQAWVEPSATAKYGDKTWMTALSMRDGQWSDPTTRPAITPVDGDPNLHTTFGSDVVTMTGGKAFAEKTTDHNDILYPGDVVTWNVKGGFVAPEDATGDLTFIDAVPEGLAPIAESITGGGVWDEVDRTITWTIPDAPNNEEYAYSYQTVVETTVTQKNNFRVKVDSPAVDPDPRFSEARDSKTVTPVQMGTTVLEKTAGSSEFAVEGSNRWLLNLQNKDKTQEQFDVIDIFPYNGDGRGTNFDGTVTYGDPELRQEDLDKYGIKTWWTDADPATIPADPSDAAHGALGDPTGNTLGWSETKPENPTAVRFTGTNLSAGKTVDFQLPFSITGASPDSKLSNIAYARATTTDLQMIRSASSTLIKDGSILRIHKAVADDTNAGPGGTIEYDIVVRNTGAGHAKNVEVTDLLGHNIESAEIAEVSGGTVDEDGVWRIPELMVDQEMTAKVTGTMVAEPDNSQPTLNAIQIENPSNPVPGTCIPNENVISDTDQCDSDIVEVPQESNITLTKTADKTEGLVAGDVVTYTFDAVNNGTTPLTDVAISETEFSGVGTMSELTCDPAQGSTLEVDGKMTCTATYTVEEGDVEAGEPITNAAKVVGFDPNGDPVEDNDDEVITPEDPKSPAIEMTKVADKTEGLVAGDIVTYTLTAKNTGDVVLNDVTISETEFSGVGDMSELACEQPTTLNPGEEHVCTVTYEVTQEDVDKGEPIHNVATVKGTDPSGTPVEDDDDETVNPVTPDPSISLTKTADKTEGLVAGDVVTYTFVATNTGKPTLSNVTISETDFSGVGAMSDLTCDPAQPSTLATGEQMTCTATYTVEEGDVESGEPITNAAKVTGEDPNGTPVEDNDDEVITPKPEDPKNPAIELTKTADKTSGLAAGDIVTYTFTAENTGDTVLNNVTISETNFSGAGDMSELSCEQPVTLNVGETLVCTATYEVQQADEDAQEPILNTAKVDGEDPDGTPVEDTDDETVTPVTPDPSISLTKTADKTEGLVAGDVVTYTFVAENTGKPTLNNVTISETDFSGVGAMSELTCDPAQPSTLATGEKMTCTATYEVTQEDVDKGEDITNAAKVTGEDDNGTPVEDTDDEVVTPKPGAPAIELVKSADKQTDLKAGDIVTYTFTATNTGDTVLNDVTISETEFSGVGDMSELACEQPTTLNPGEALTCTATYEVQQADVDKGEDITNAAKVTGVDPNGTPVEDNDDEIVTPDPAKPAIELVKTADNKEPGVGETVTYTFVATNTGNVDLSNVVIAETEFSGAGDMSELACEQPAELAIGESLTCTATYVVEEGDKGGVDITNTAKVTGEDPNGTPVEDTDDEVVTPPAVPAIHLDKVADKTSGLVAGDVVTYTFKATNTGTVDLTEVSISETEFSGHGEMSELVGDVPETLAVGESFDMTATYTVTQEDVDAQKPITNAAVADGKGPDGTPVKDDDDEIVEPAPEPGVIELVKSADKTEGLVAGDTVTYTFEATNVGKVTLSNVTIAEESFSGAGEMSELECEQGVTLAPGMSTTCTATYEVQQADVDAAKAIDNTAKVTGEDPLGNPVEDTDDESVNPEVGGPAVKLVKTADKTEGLVAGDVVTYTFVGTNIGDQKLTDVTIAETEFSGVGEMSELSCEDKSELAPGETITCTATYEVQQGDVDAGKEIDNVATITGKAPNGESVTDEDDEKVAPKPANPALSLTKTPDKSAALAVGDVVTYTLTATNSGDVTLNDVAIAEGEFSGLGDLGELTCDDKSTLAPGESRVCTVTYTITKADAQAGDEITNTATATGKDPNGGEVNAGASAAVSPVMLKAPAPQESGTPGSIAALLIMTAAGAGGATVISRRRRDDAA